MKLLFKLLSIVALLFMLSAGKNVGAQDSRIPSIYDSSKEAILDTVIENYTKTFDSLLIDERYDDVIEIGEPLLLVKEHEIYQLTIPYLICAYYYSGSIERSKKLLDEKISKLDYKALIALLTSSKVAFIKYLSVPANREPIIIKVINDYRKNEKATNKEAGEQIIRFFINDQRSRKVKYAHKRDDQMLQPVINQEFKKLDSIQNVQVYAFYKLHDKYFSEEEVSTFVSELQPIVLSHYNNIELRQTFFKDLLEKAVSRGHVKKTTYVNFILRTESFTNPDFFRQIESRIEEVRKEYDLPDYTWNPF